MADNGEVEDYRLRIDDWGFTNRRQPLDVNDDRGLTSSDALAVIDYLNLLVPDATGNIPLPVQPPNEPLDPLGGGEGLALFVDVNGDGLLTAADALIVIDQLNLQNEPDGSGGEGEAAAFSNWLPLANLAPHVNPAAPSAPVAVAPGNGREALHPQNRSSAELLGAAIATLASGVHLAEPTDLEDTRKLDMALEELFVEGDECTTGKTRQILPEE
jgi:hypothetical protein